MIDGVELRVLDQPHQVRKFQRDGAAGLERRLQAAGEVVDVGHVGIDIVADDQVGLLPIGGQLLGQSLAKEFAQHGNAQLSRQRRRCWPSARCRGRECRRPRNSSADSRRWRRPR